LITFQWDGCLGRLLFSVFVSGKLNQTRMDRRREALSKPCQGSVTLQGLSQTCPEETLWSPSHCCMKRSN
jgi:hypothetical protein